MFDLVDTYIYRCVFTDNIIHIYVHVLVQLCVSMYVYDFVRYNVTTQPPLLSFGAEFSCYII